MIEVPVYDETGKQTGAEQIDEAALGGRVRPQLLKQAIVMYHANRRQGHAVQKSRGQVRGSTVKLYRQKGTGRARAGSARTNIRRGGGRAFPCKLRDFRQGMPRKMRRLARNNAVLAKIMSHQAAIVDGLVFDEPKTKRLAAVLGGLGGDRGCVVAIKGSDPNLYKGGRNIPRAIIQDVAELNAFEILTRRKLLFTRDAFAAFRDGLSVSAGGNG